MFFVFDVESIGLHGEAFAVAWVVVTKDGQVRDEGCLSCDPSGCAGADESRQWVADNIPPLHQTHSTSREMREAFWKQWREWEREDAVMVADCAWPVEARFLIQCVDDNHDAREWEGPYPLHDLASVFLAFNQDPRAPLKRLPNELPAHHPLMDARQSARLLVSALAPRERAGN